VEISIWENGDVNIEQFEKDLRSHFTYALLDVFTEFHVLNTPICSIPQRLQCSQQSSRRESMMHRRNSFTQMRSGVHSSASSSGTTPKFGKTNISHTNSVTGKKYSDSGTPIRLDSPTNTTLAATAGGGKEELKLIVEAAGSFPKEYVGNEEGSPRNEQSKVKRTPSSDSTKLDSPISSIGKRDSPAMRREGSFTRKDSPGLQRKLSAR